MDIGQNTNINKAIYSVVIYSRRMLKSSTSRWYKSVILLNIIFIIGLCSLKKIRCSEKKCARKTRDWTCLLLICRRRKQMTWGQMFFQVQISIHFCFWGFIFYLCMKKIPVKKISANAINSRIQRCKCRAYKMHNHSSV